MTARDHPGTPSAAGKDIFVLGLDEGNRRVLEAMPDAGRYRFHQVLSVQELYGGVLSFGAALIAAQQVLDGVDGPIDAIVGYWDFPVTALVPLLRERYGLATYPLRDVVMCEHKYWCRRIQAQVIEEYPPFGLVDPHRDQSPPQGLRFPMWIKPVKSFSSMLAFGVADHAAFADALGTIRGGIARFGEPFDALLAFLELPPEIAAVGGQACVVEETLHGRQVTVEGYRYQGTVVIYGVIDSVCYPNSPSFARYQYPASLPADVTARLSDISRTVVEAIGMEGMTFNIEYFWDPDTDAIGLLEINPRHSQSHAALFAAVDGMANHAVMLHLALDQEPQFPHRQGSYPIAAKCFLRRFSDGIVRRHPTREEIDTIEDSVAGTTINLVAHTGDRLSHMHAQDSYSYELANVYIGAADEAELNAKFHHVSTTLRYEIDDAPHEDHATQ